MTVVSPPPSPFDAFPVENNGLSRAAKNDALFHRRPNLKLISQFELQESVKVETSQLGLRLTAADAPSCATLASYILREFHPSLF